MGNSDRRNRIFNYIIQQTAANSGRVPTRREIGNALNLSTSVVDFHMRKLADEKRIVFDAIPGRSHNYTVVGGRWVYESV